MFIHLRVRLVSFGRRYSKCYLARAKSPSLCNVLTDYRGGQSLLAWLLGYLSLLQKTCLSLPPKWIGGSVARVDLGTLRSFVQTLQWGNPVLFPWVPRFGEPGPHHLPWLPACCGPGCSSELPPWALVQAHPWYSWPYNEQVRSGGDVIAAKTCLGTEAREWWCVQSGQSWRELPKQILHS